MRHEVFEPEQPEAGPDEMFEVLPGIGEEIWGLNLAVNGVSGCEKEPTVDELVMAAFEKGRAEGRAEADACRRQLDSRLSSVLHDISESVHVMLVRLEDEMLKLSIEIAKKIVKKEISAATGDVLKNQITTCLRQLDREVPVQLRLSPGDVSFVQNLLEKKEHGFSVLQKIRIVEDRRVGSGGCVLETDKRTLRATISDQLDKLEQVLEREYGISVTEEMGSVPSSCE